MSYVGTDIPNMDPGEVKTYSFDFTSKLVNAETVSSIAWSCASVGGLDLNANSRVSTPTLSGSVASTKISGLQPSIKYVIQAQATSSAGNVYSLWTHVLCQAPT